MHSHVTKIKRNQYSSSRDKACMSNIKMKLIKLFMFLAVFISFYFKRTFRYYVKLFF